MVKTDKFLELSLVNYVRNNDDFADGYDKLFSPFIEELQKLLSKEVCGDLETKLAECTTEALYYAGVAGMELAIGVMNGTIKQTIE